MSFATVAHWIGAFRSGDRSTDRPTHSALPSWQAECVGLTDIEWIWHLLPFG